MGRPKGAKNRRTLLREAELKLVDRGEFLDALVVLEEGMRHFYTRAVQLKQGGFGSKEVDANLMKAVDIAEKVMPYRHHRLAAIKVDTKGIVSPNQHKSLEHLRAQMQKHFERLAPVLDLEAIMVSSEPSDGVANRELDISAAVIDTAPKKEDLN